MLIESVMPSNHLILSTMLSSSPPGLSLPQHPLMCQPFSSGGHSIGASASASVLPVNIQDWFPLGWTGLHLPFLTIQFSSMEDIHSRCCMAISTVCLQCLLFPTEMLSSLNRVPSPGQPPSYFMSLLRVQLLQIPHEFESYSVCPFLTGLFHIY